MRDIILYIYTYTAKQKRLHRYPFFYQSQWGWGNGNGLAIGICIKYKLRTRHHHWIEFRFHAEFRNTILAGVRRIVLRCWLPLFIHTTYIYIYSYITISIYVMHTYVMLFCGRVWQWFLPINSSVVIDFELHRSARLNSHYAYVWI